MVLVPREVCAFWMLGYHASRLKEVDGSFWSMVLALKDGFRVSRLWAWLFGPGANFGLITRSGYRTRLKTNPSTCTLNA